MLNMQGSPINYTNVKSFKSASTLEVLQIGIDKRSKISQFSTLTNLKFLAISFGDELVSETSECLNLFGLENIKSSLKILSFYDELDISSVALNKIFKDLTNLKMLHMYGFNTILESTTPISFPESLIGIDIDTSPKENVTCLVPGLLKCSKLQLLGLKSPGLLDNHDFNTLGFPKGLEYLEISAQNYSIKEFCKPFESLNNLQYLCYYSNKEIAQDEGLSCLSKTSVSLLTGNKNALSIDCTEILSLNLKNKFGKPIVGTEGLIDWNFIV